MTTLTVTARGQVTFRRDVLQHLGIRPGEKTPKMASLQELDESHGDGAFN